MTLFEQWELIEYIANKDYQGNVITPDRFNQLIKVVNLDLFKIKMGLPEDYQVGMPLSRQYVDLNKRLNNETIFLKTQINPKSVVAGILAYPANYFMDNSLRYEYQRNIDGSPTVIPQHIEILTEQEYTDRSGNYTKAPSVKNPVGVLRADGIYIYPDTITSIDFNYIRYPNDPEFDYNVAEGYITDGGSSVEYEWEEHLHMDLTAMILRYVGINIREQQLESYAAERKAQGV